MLGNFSYFFLLSADIFQNNFFRKNYFTNTFRLSNSLDPDQDRHFVEPEQESHFVCPDLVPNYLQMLSVDDKSRR